MRIKLRGQDKNEVKTYKQTVVNAVILVVVLALCLYVAIQISQNFSTQVSTQRTQMVTDVTYSYFDGCIFKDGEIITASCDIVHYLVPDGAKVGVGQAYAEIYSGTSIPEGERAAVEEKLNDLSTRITMLEAGIAGGSGVSDLGVIGKDISDSYYSYINSILNGDISDADVSGDNLLGSLINYSIYSADRLAEAAKTTLAALKNERASLISEMGGTKTVLVSKRSFTFYRHSDGYENILNSSVIGSLDRNKLDELIKIEQSDTHGSIGSAIYSSKWYIALPTDEAGYEIFAGNTGKTFEIEMLGADGLKINMLLEAVVAKDIGNTEILESETDEESTENAEIPEALDTSRTYLIFSSFDLAKIASFDRHQSVRITLDSSTGYRIPKEAVHTVGDNRGVYILIGNMIEFRRITVIGEGDGYYIAATYERDLAEDVESEIPYLNINDLIVTSGRDLYDGKLLD